MAEEKVSECDREKQRSFLDLSNYDGGAGTTPARSESHAGLCE